MSHGLRCWTWDLGQDISSGPGNSMRGQWMAEEGVPSLPAHWEELLTASIRVNCSATRSGGNAKR